MITEIEFIRDFTSFWRTLSPLSQDFVRHINCEVQQLATEPKTSTSKNNSRRALLNEVGFDLFEYAHEKQIKVENVKPEILLDITKKASSYISQLRTKAPVFNIELNPNEVDEIYDITNRLLSFFSDFEAIKIKPKFPGYGKLNSCLGDVLANKTLYEIKAGNRPFRSIDLRQLALYQTLNHFSKQYTINKLALFNPRLGYHFSIPHHDFSIHFSGLSTEELCHRIAYELMSTEQGRFEDPI